ncbi:MAG: amine dehydrogenase large subunit [Pseudomonadales bacterium]
MVKTLRNLALLTLLWTGVQAQAEFTPESLGQVATLPSPYPDHWLIVQDLAFNHMREGRFYIVDPAATTAGGQMKGILSADFIASLALSARRNEIYVIESFFARGGRGGERTDVVTIYDPATLDVAGEVVIPAKRLTGMPNHYQVALIDDDRFMVVYNFTPSQSVSVIDLETRQFLGEIGIPGCAFVYPTGRRGFSSLCSDGGLLTTRLQSDGSLEQTERLPSFNDIAADAMFEKPAVIDGIAYFPTFTGNVVPVDLRGEGARVGERWALTNTAERDAGWRPGGAWPAIADRSGRLYVLMHGHGAEGTHKDGGDQVWVFDARQGQRLGTIELNDWGIALGMSAGSDQRLVVTRADGGVDLYDPRSGERQSTLLMSMDTPLLVRGVR